MQRLISPIFLLLIALFSMSASPGNAQTSSRNDSIYQYQGADREKRLLDGARAEGKLTLYTSMAPSESRPLGEAFEKKYGVKVEIWRALSEKVLQRLVTEGQAKKHTVDVVETNSPEMEMAAREKLFNR